MADARVDGVLSKVAIIRSYNRGGYSFVACLSHLTIHHAPFPRRSTDPSPNRDTPKIWGLMTFFSHILDGKLLLILFLSYSAVCGHRTRIESFSRYYLVYQTSPCQIRQFSSSPLTHPVLPSICGILPLCDFYSPLLCHKGTSVHLLPPPLNHWFTSSFWQVQVPYTKSHFQRFRVVQWAVQIHFHSNFFS